MFFGKNLVQWFLEKKGSKRVFSQPAFICSKLTIETLEQGGKYVLALSCFFIVNFEHISHLVLVTVSIFVIEHVIAGWVKFHKKSMH